MHHHIAVHSVQEGSGEMALMDSKALEIWCVPGCKKCQQENERREKRRKKLLEQFLKAGAKDKDKDKAGAGKKDLEPLTPKKTKTIDKAVGAKGHKNAKK